jgi:thiamine biosynthesis lipoprotein ApbE
MNPKNPNEFNFDIKSVSVISSSVEQSDVWAKTLFLMGKGKGMEYSLKNDVASVFLYYNGNVQLSQKAKEFVN